jgi:small subunit ribosomal protein S8
MTTDPIADMLARIRNAAMAHHGSTRMPASNIKSAIAEILKREGFISDFRVDKNDEGQETLTVVLKYADSRRAAFAGLKRVSRPGRRVYVGYQDIPRVLSGLGMSILSTSSGVITDREARSRKIGGELLCEVW